MLSKDVLEDVTASWAEKITKETVIPRDITPLVERTIQHEELTVMKGVRRAGKTFVLYELFQKHGGTYVNFEDERLHNFSLEDFERLYDIARTANSRILYMDEVQVVSGWEKFAHRAHRDIKMFVTGSNSKLLSSNYSNALVGRTMGFKLEPLSYNEFLRFRGISSERKSLLEYMKRGGFPRIALTGETSLASEYLDRILYRDILGSAKIMHPEALRSLALYLLSNVGKEFSYRSLRSMCGVKHENTVKDYLGLLRDAFLVEVINRFHPSLKTQETYGKKIYSVDPAFIGLGKRIDDDRGRILENLVYLHLRRSGDIYFGKNGREVDFIVCNGLKPQKAINVTYETKDVHTLNREIASLTYFQKELGVEGELLSLYPCDLPPGLKFHLVHRYLNTT